MTDNPQNRRADYGTRPLPPEYIALIEHMELHQAGWWNFGLQRLVLAALWVAGPAMPSELPRRVADLAGLNPDPGTISNAVADLQAADLVFALADGTLKLGEAASALLEKELLRVEQADDAAKDRFDDALSRHDIPVEVDACWRAFNDMILIPLIRELGARVYELLAGTPGELLDASRDLDRVIAELAPGHQEQLGRALAEFLDPHDQIIRTYVLRRLNAYFFLEAARLPSSTLDALARQRSGTSSFHIFVDTNFLFSVLGLHENPSNDAAIALQHLIGQVEERIDVKLYVLPITVEETKRVLRNHAINLEGLVLPANLAQASAPQLTGLTRRYLAQAASSPTRLSADEFFGAYETDLLTILRSKGVELYNEPTDGLRTDQAVLDDLLAQEEFQDRTRRGGAKPYDANLHDMVVWHFVHRKRPAVAESPLDARYWIITVDFGFLSFDKHQWRTRGGAQPLCLHPATLTQLLQFWVPRDEAFEEALLGAFRLPFLHVDFSPEAEAVTLRILRKLSRFEDIDDLAPETLGAILENQALRGRISNAGNEAAEDELVEQALVDELRALEGRLAERVAQMEEVEAQATGEVAALRANVEAGQRALETTAAEAQRLREELASSKTDLETERNRSDRATEDIQDLEERISSLETVLDTERSLNATRRSRQLFGSVALVGAAATATLAVFVGRWIARATDLPSWLAYGAVGLGLMAVFLLVTEQVGARASHLGEWSILRALNRLRRLLVAAAITVLLGVTATAVYEAIS